MWVTIIFESSATPKTHANVTRCYTKGGMLCLELDERDHDGLPIIVAYPLVNIFSVARPHLHHLGSEPRPHSPKGPQ